MKKIGLVFVGLVFLLSGCSTGKSAQKTETSETKVVQETSLYFVRHGKTMFNATGQVQGWSDTPLTDEGVQGAKELAIGLKKTPFVLAYSSDLGRAMSTANYILGEGNRKELTLETLSGLREWNYGGYEGRDNADMWTPIFEKNGLKFDEEWTQYDELTKKLSDEEIADEIAANDKTGTAENYQEIVKRSKAAMDQILAEAKVKGGGNVLIVAHGSEIPTILEILVPGGYQGEAIKNCSVTTVKVNNENFTIDKIGDLSYLEKGQKQKNKQ
jgi:broad specificity phosphatase PhoE